MALDDGPLETFCDDRGYFELRPVPDGDHSLFVRTPDGREVELPCRIRDGRSISFGRISFRDGELMGHTGFDGYRCAFVDENEDGFNDLFADADGDGICDEGKPYAGYAYMMGCGYEDRDGDGVNDFFRDADGNGISDLTGMEMPYSHGCGWSDENGDGINDRFRDADGDGVNDLDRRPYRYGFHKPRMDVDGNGIDDVTGMPYCLGFGWVDENGDGINDVFSDADGDGVNDRTGMGYGGGLYPGPGGPPDGMGPINWPGMMGK